jgi:REP element-mobilizing transposase RayT
MTGHPFAIHITWTTYATWLPGDRRGHVSNTLCPGGGFEPKQNTPGTPYAEGDPYTHDRARSAQSYAAVRLDREQAVCVALALVRVAAEQGWRVLRAAVMRNHTHVVITDCPDDGPAVRRVLKGVTQVDLSAQLGRPWRWWTKGGSDRYKHDRRAIDAAVNYVARQPGMLAGVDDMRAFMAGEDGAIRYLDDSTGELPPGERPGLARPSGSHEPGRAGET